MEDNKDLVMDVTENVEQTTEETQGALPVEKTYTQSQLDEIVGKRLARNSAKIRKEYERKYGNLEEVLKAGTGKESVEEITDTFTKFYESKGMKINREPNYTAKDIEVLAKAEAADVINSGYEEVVDEVDRLARIGLDKMTDRDKVYFKALCEHRKKTERQNELSKIGVTEDVFNSKEFQDFASMFKESTPIADIYKHYQKTQPKKEIKPMGSMKNTTADNSTVKDFYSYEEASKFTQKEIDNNPQLFEAIQKSMLKW